MTIDIPTSRPIQLNKTLPLKDKKKILKEHPNKWQSNVWPTFYTFPPHKVP